MGANTAARGGSLLLAWLQDKFDDIHSFYGDTFVNNVKQMVRAFPEEAATSSEHQRFAAFLDRRRADLGSAVDKVQQGLDKIAANIKWRNRFLAQVQDWMAKEVAKKVAGKDDETAELEEEIEGSEGFFNDFVSGRLLCPIDVLGLFCD